MDDAPDSPAVSLERRVKRHVLAPVHGWFASCAPGLEALLLAEARALGLAGAEAVPGGLAFRGRLADGWRANLCLRTAGRVWLRVAEAPARAPEDVFRVAREVPWEALLPPGLPVRIQAVTSRSRVFGGGFLARPIRDAAGRRLRALGLVPPDWQEGGGDGGDGPGEVGGDPEDPAAGGDGMEARAGAGGGDDGDLPMQRLLARLDRNRLVLSLDSSGAPLHRRGFRVRTPAAPLRETLAAAVLLAAGYDGTAPLADPFCGSATFAAEACAIARRLPPGRGRPFLFQRWPSWRPGAFQHLQGALRAEALPCPAAPLWCRDVDPAALDLARDHLDRAGVAEGVALDQADFFAEPAPGGPPGLAVLNPPYGLRLDAGEAPESFFRRVGRRLRQAWRGWSCAVVCPSAACADALALPGARRLAPAHGGLRAVVVLARL